MARSLLTRRAFASALPATLLLAPALSRIGTALAEEPASGATPEDEPAAAPSPDYADLATWVYWADEMTVDRGDVVCGASAAPGFDGSTPAADKPVDLFIVCPTVSMGSDGAATMDLANADDRASFVGALNMELGIYSDVCRVFAPLYRQATLAMYEASADELASAIDFAYADVAAAFESYLVEEAERPFVLAGFSQGSEHIVRLIRDYLGDAPEQAGEQDGHDNERDEDGGSDSPSACGTLSARFVAAYAIGWRLTEEECAKHPRLKAAQAADDTGVVVTFNSEDPEVEDSIIVPAGTRTLAINPLSWSVSSEEAPAELNLGACFTDYSGAVIEEVPEFCGAYLDAERGTLKVVGVDPADYPPSLSIFDEGVYHLYDYQFFYRNLQENVATRVEAYLDERAAATGLVTEQSRS